MELPCSRAECEYTAKVDSWDNSIHVMELHERGKHGVVGVVRKEEKEGDEKKEDKGERKRQEKRAQTKLPTFEEEEMRDEFRRKTKEFHTYATRTELKTEEMAEDLYSALSTPLKRRMLASSKIKSQWRETDPKVILEEMEKVCLPPLNLVVEQQQFAK